MPHIPVEHQIIVLWALLLADLHGLPTAATILAGVFVLQSSGSRPNGTP